MKKQEVEVGKTYRVKVSGALADVRITGENPHGGWDGVNIATKRTVRIKSAQRLRSEVRSGRGGVSLADRTVVFGRVYSVRTGSSYQPVRIDTGIDDNRFEGVNMRTGRPATVAEDAIRGDGQSEDEWRARTARTQAQPTTPQADAATPSADTPASQPAAEASNPTPKSRRREPAQTSREGGRKLGILGAAAQMLAEAHEPLNCKAIVERALAQGIWTTNGKTPQGTLHAAICREIVAKGEDSRFRKTERGKFTLAK